jgi:hypothetical protein
VDVNIQECVIIMWSLDMLAAISPSLFNPQSHDWQMLNCLGFFTSSVYTDPYVYEHTMVTFIHSFIHFPVGCQPEHRAPFVVSAITHAIRHTVGLLWTSDQPIAEASTYTTYKHKRQTSMPRAGFKPAVPATKRPWTYTLDCAATGISSWLL